MHFVQAHSLFLLSIMAACPAAQAQTSTPPAANPKTSANARLKLADEAFRALQDFRHKGLLLRFRDLPSQPLYKAAFQHAAQMHDALTLSEPLDRIIAQDRLREIPGVGEAIAAIIKRLHATGTHPGLERMREEVPQGVLDLLTVPGLRPDKIVKLLSAGTVKG